MYHHAVCHVRFISSSSSLYNYASLDASLQAAAGCTAVLYCILPMAAHSSRSCTSPALQQKMCPMCSFECPSIALLLSHLRLVHSNDPRFLVCCGINSCTVTSRSFSSLYTHVYRHHPDAAIRRQSANSSSVVQSTSTSSVPHEYASVFETGTCAQHLVESSTKHKCLCLLSSIILSMYIYHLQTLSQLQQTLIDS